MDPEQLAILLRKYYEQDKELRRLEADLEAVSLPIDFDQLSLQEATDQLLHMMDEVSLLQESVPDRSARNHEADLDQVLTILHNEYNRMESVRTGQEEGSETEEQRTVIGSARRIRDKIREIESLKQQLRDKVEQVRILHRLPHSHH